MNEHEERERKREKPTLIVSALVMDGDKYLITRTDKFDFWRPPGGRVDWGESLEDALKREMKEELGTEIEIIKTLGFGEDSPLHKMHDYKTHRVIVYFLCEAKEKITSFSDEEEPGAKMKWVTFEELMKIEDIEPAFKDMINRFKPNIE